ncbi:MAG: hypothetical protein AAF488_08245 [Planctomycetota bacterium]
MRSSSRVILGGFALVAFIVAGGLVYWRSGHPIEYVPVDIEIVLKAQGVSFYLGDEYQGQSTLMLDSETPRTWTVDQLGITPGESRWKPANVLPTLLSDPSIRVRKTLGHGLRTGGHLDDDTKVKSFLRANTAVFDGAEGADQFVLLRLELNAVGSDQVTRLGPWRVRAYAPGRPEFAMFKNDLLEVTPLSSALETWFFRRVRYAARLTAEVALVPGREDLGRTWIEKAEEERVANGLEPSQSGPDARGVGK